VVFGQKAPIARIDGVMAVIAHHPVVVHFKGVSIGFFSVYKNIITINFNRIMLINRNGAAIYRKGKAVQLNRPALF
jgi:hypothetical protein